MSSDVSTLAAGVDRAFFFIVGISVALLVVVTALMVYFVFKYHQSKHNKPKNIEGHVGLEIVWIVVPTIIVLAMFYYGWIGFKPMRDIPEDAMVIRVEGRMWGWSFEYKSGKKADVLRVPVGRNIRLNMISLDVLHALYIPAFRVKEDLLPRRETHLWFVSNRVGSYDLMCAEFCGMGHSKMHTKVIVMSQENFDTWYVASDNVAWVPLNGKELLERHGCADCHSTDGSKMLGPTFKGLFGKKRNVIIAGENRTEVANEEYLRKGILDPNDAIVEGFQPIMPSSKGILSQAELDAIVAYLKELGGENARAK